MKTKIESAPIHTQKRTSDNIIASCSCQMPVSMGSVNLLRIIKKKKFRGYYFLVSFTCSAILVIGTDLSP